METITEKAPNQAIFKYAFCGTKELFYDKLNDLALLAEEEDWTGSSSTKNSRLYNYIIKTFERCQEQNLVVVSANELFSVFNTGLMTNNGEDIYGYFIPNKKQDAQKWFLKDFIVCSDRNLSQDFFDKPRLAEYGNKEDFYFDTDISIELSADHIFDDHWDEPDRYPDKLKNLGKSVAVSLIKSAFETSKKKVKRNNRLVVPQFYKQKIMYLMPIEIPINDIENITMALAIEKLPNQTYRANTIFTLEMAYPKARLVMKPESSWLITK